MGYGVGECLQFVVRLLQLAGALADAVFKVAVQVNVLERDGGGVCERLQKFELVWCSSMMRRPVVADRGNRLMGSHWNHHQTLYESRPIGIGWNSRIGVDVFNDHRA